MATTKTVSVWYDDQFGPESGWVARCTEYEDGQRVAVAWIASRQPK